jgi:DNA helicase-2/ATP-dependent DNA helicase PcrA
MSSSSRHQDPSQSAVCRADDYPVVAEEVALLAQNLEALQQLPPEAQLDSDAIVAEMGRLRDEIPTAQTDERPGLMDQYERLGNLLLQQGASLSGEGVDPHCPYFAHMRLHQDGREREVFLGKATRLDNGLRIVDWRHAPISALFYRYAEGDEFVEDIGGREVEGTVLARRVVGIAEGQLNRVQAPQGLFLREGAGWALKSAAPPRLEGGQGASVRGLLARSTAGRGKGLKGGGGYRVEKHLPEISALIDAEQFEVISAPDAELVVIRGVAGSGKTTVALHRLAFLNYQSSTRFRADRMLVVVWGDALRRFISRLLPALGVHSTPVLTYGYWAGGLRKRLFPFLPKHSTDTTPAVVTRLKLHPALLPILEHYVADNPGPRTASQVIEDWMQVMSDEGLLRDGLDRWAPGAFSEGQLQRALRWTSQQVGQLGDFLHPEDREIEEDADGTPIRVDDHFLDSEDDPLLLRLYQLRVGPLPTASRRNRPLRYQHIVVDEVQDLSPLEVRVLMDCLDEHRSMTLAGDTQQHVLQEAGFTDWEEFFSHLGVKGAAVNTLKVAYRSTRPIVRFSRQILGDLAEDEEPEVSRDGAEVELLTFQDHGECIVFLADSLRELADSEPNANVALLARTPETAELYWQGLSRADLPRLARVRDQEFCFEPGFEVTDVAQAKGLEFDYVVLLDVSETAWPRTDAGRRLLHVGATRAAHQLWVCCVGKPSPLLPLNSE